MPNITYIDRQTKKKEIEKVYKEKAIRFLYGNQWPSFFAKYSLLPFVAKSSFFSCFYGYLQKLPSSAKKIAPFIQHFNIDPAEFANKVEEYRSFNDFFIRKLKAEVRPIDAGAQTAVIPADGRYYFYSDISKCPGFIVKGKKFELDMLLGDMRLAEKYQEGSMVMARLCPSDYHRFHFPCDCIPGKTKMINGYLYSVNPIAVKKNIQIFVENKRNLCELSSDIFGKVLYMEIGATNVGSIQETYSPGKKYAKGAEKGYFEFGGSALILLFEKNAITFDSDLLAATEDGLEIRCLLGQSMGRSK